MSSTRTIDKYFHLKTNLDPIYHVTNWQDLRLNLLVNNTLIVVSDLLTRSECQSLIDLTDCHYLPIDAEYLPK